jgi:hypothetical protein
MLHRILRGGGHKEKERVFNGVGKGEKTPTITIREI